MARIINKPILKLRKASQPPLSYPGATPEADRAKAPPVGKSRAPEKLNPGDRVEGLGNFGKPTGKFGRVERTNDDDAVVKWDDDGRTRLPQLRLKKAFDTEYEKALLKAHALHEGLYHRVADKLGIDPSYVSRVARGKRDAPDVLRAVLDELHRIQLLLK